MITLVILLIIVFNATVAIFTLAAYVVVGIIGAILACFGLYSASSSSAQQKRKEKSRKFSDEEILALGLYPQDEGYKMHLISQILDK